MWLQFAFFASLLTPLLHVVVLVVSGQNGIATPISQLSQPPWGDLHTIELVLFGASHVALAVALGGLDRGRLWPYGRLLLVASSLVLVYIAYFFSTADAGTLSGPAANDPLWLVATLTGFAMGALQPGLSRLSPQLGMFSGICLGAWLWLIPLIKLVDESWIGGYERLVGSLYVLWIVGVAFGLMQLGRVPRDGRVA